MNPNRGKTTPGSTGGSYKPTTGQKSRVGVAGEQPATMPIDPAAVVEDFLRRQNLDQFEKAVADFSSFRDTWQDQNPGWSVIGCDGGSRNEPPSIRVSGPDGAIYEVSRDDVDERVVECNYEYLDEPPAAISGPGGDDSDHGTDVYATYDELAHISRRYGYEAVAAINTALSTAAEGQPR